MALNNRQEVQEYIINKLNNTYTKYTGGINLNTTFDQLERNAVSDFVGAHLFIDIEEELGIELTDDEAGNLNSGDVEGVVNYLVSKLGL